MHEVQREALHLSDADCKQAPLVASAIHWRWRGLSPAAVTEVLDRSRAPSPAVWAMACCHGAPECWYPG